MSVTGSCNRTLIANVKPAVSTRRVSGRRSVAPGQPFREPGRLVGATIGRTFVGAGDPAVATGSMTVFDR